MIKAIIFDVDGVILDTVPYHFSAWKRLFNEQGQKFTFKDYLLGVNGLPRIVGIKNILTNLPSGKLKKLAEKKQNYYLEMVAKVTPEPLAGVVKLLKTLKKKGFKLAAASSSENVVPLLLKAHLDTYFSTIVSGSDFSRPKPDPEIFLTASASVGIAPKKCVVVEDAYSGILAAKNAGMKTIGLLTSNDLQIEKVADLTINSLADSDQIIDYLEKFGDAPSSLSD